MEKALNVDSSFFKKCKYNVFDQYEEITNENQKKNEIIEVKEISKKLCEEKNINVNRLVLKELEELGFKKDLPSFFLSKIIEEFYHEREAFDDSEYFDLSFSNNEHYSSLQNKYCIYPLEAYRGFVAKAVGESSYENKNINDVVFDLVKRVSKKIEASKKLTLENKESD
ncbi:MAG: hypothetical protein IIZ40_04085 [Bacilli bacterium]|nr:hypothetical protein [Bacilli bacterium]